MLQLTDSQKVRVQVTGLDKKGQPATIPSVSFSSSDANVASVVQDPGDPSSADVSAGVPGACQIKASATLADGSTAEGVLDITVVGGAAVSLSLTAGAPSEQ
jgi:hypothetical protein